MNFGPGVSSQQAVQREQIARPAGQRLLFSWQEAVQPRPAGAGDGKNTLLFRVQVDQLAGLQVGAVQTEGPVHSSLLVYGEHRLQRRMGQGMIGQKGKDHRHSDAVIRPQGGLFRPDPLPVRAQLQAVFCHVFGAALRLDAHHVDMPLEHHRGGILVAR